MVVRRSAINRTATTRAFESKAPVPASVSSRIEGAGDMKMRALGRQGLKVSELGLGCMGLSDFYSSSGVTEAQGISLIQRALSLGVTFLDTADVYGPHTNEVTVGKALRGRRDSVGYRADSRNHQPEPLGGKPGGAPS